MSRASGDRTRLRAKAEAKVAAGPRATGPPQANPSFLRLEAFRKAIDALPIGVTIVELAEDGKPRFIAHNSAYDRMPGPQPVDGTAFEDLPYQVFHPDRTTPMPVEDWPGPRAARTGQAVFNADVHTLQRGEWRVLSVSAAPIPALDPGEPRRAVAVLLDVTDRVEQARQVEEVRARLSHVIDGSNDGFFDLSLETGQVKCSRGLASMLGYDLSELGTDVADFQRMIDPEDRERDRAARESHLRGESDQYVVELRLRHKDGQWRWFAARGKVVGRAADGHPVRVAGTLTDITQRRRAEDALRVQQAQLDIAARSGGLGLWDLDLVTNQAWRTIQHDRLFGYDALQPSWGTDEALRHVVPEDRPIFRRAFEEALSTGHFHYELRINRASGGLRWIEASGEVFRDEAGKPVRMAGTVVDVTELRATQEQLSIASRLAAMGRLVSGLAHQVNNPLAAQLSGQGVALEVLGDLRERILQGSLQDRTTVLRNLEDAIEALEDARAGGQRIARIVKDLAIFAHPEPRRSRLRLADVVSDALRWMPGSVAKTASVEVTHQDAPEVMISSAQIEQVIVHLVTNAAKAAIPGTRGEIALRTGPGTRGMARLEVADRGVGIEPANLDRMFEPFFTTRPVGEERGTGLGLAVCHAIVTAHGGTLTVKSAPRKGATFRVELPAAPRGGEETADR